MFAVWILLAFMFLYIIRTVQGPTIWDRLLGMSLISVKVIILIVAYASFSNRGYLLDYALIYALFGFISLIFIAFFILDRTRGNK
ncbi:MAG: monovalent cation/H+ antiporter complex subunit F [Oscillospiraceae bacterium]|nr:monovalent cation/H+ antiporter complex subunit F [Oscillospiraceae bacterium]